MSTCKVSYVVGFLFNTEMTRVWLIRKNRPSWQRGKLNGIGGHIEDGESPMEAMRREFWEEAGVPVHTWEQTMTLRGREYTLHTFRSFVGEKIFSSPSSQTDEVVECLDLADLHRAETLENLKWIIPFQLDTDLRVPIEVYDETNPGEGRTKSDFHLPCAMG